MSAAKEVESDDCETAGPGVQIPEDHRTAPEGKDEAATVHFTGPGCYPPTCLGRSIQPSVSAYPFETERKGEAIPSMAEKICSPLKLPWSESIPFISTTFQFAYATVTEAVVGKC